MSSTTLTAGCAPIPSWPADAEPQPAGAAARPRPQGRARPRGHRHGRNGRWAAAKGLPRNKGHEAGEAGLFDTVEGGLDAGLSWLTVYAFSTENWRRPASEVRFLMNFNESLLVRRSHELHEREVRIRFIGRRDRIPPHVRRRIEEAEDLTAADTRMTLAVALDYGGRDELARAVQALAAEVREGRGPRRIDERAIARHLYAPEMPDVDLLIRTSNEYRISNFLLWQIAYAELHFTPVLWPDFNRHELFEALRIYTRAATAASAPLPIPRTLIPTHPRSPGPTPPPGPAPDLIGPGAGSRASPTRSRAGSPGGGA